MKQTILGSLIGLMKSIIPPEGIAETGDSRQSSKSDSVPSVVADPKAVTRSAKAIDWKQAREMSGKVIIPECMTEINRRLFDRNQKITSVEIPGTVKKIGDRAFADCSALEEVILHEGIEEIGGNVFSGTRIRHLICPDSIRKIRGWAFFRLELDAPVTNASKTMLIYWPPNLITASCSVPQGIEVICTQAFSDAPDLKELNLPDSLRRIESRAFIHCGFREITIPASVCFIASDAFLDCQQLETVSILNPAAEVIPGAFAGCRALKEIRWAGNRTLIDDLHLRGRSFLDANGLRPKANLDHTADERFRQLSERCGKGDADAMEEMAEWFETWSRKPDASDFYVRAAHFWYYRASRAGQPQATRWLEAWMNAHPGQCLPAALFDSCVEPLGIDTGAAKGLYLNQLGFPFFDAERVYSLTALREKGLTEVGSYRESEGPDEDGFGREELYDWWYLDLHLNTIPGIPCIPGCSFSGKINGHQRFDTLIEKASGIVRGERES